MKRQATFYLHIASGSTGQNMYIYRLFTRVCQGDHGGEETVFLFVAHGLCDVTNEALLTPKKQPLCL